MGKAKTSIGLIAVENVSKGEPIREPKIKVKSNFNGKIFLKYIFTWDISFLILSMICVIIQYAKLGENYKFFEHTLTDIGFLNMSISFLLSIFLESMMNAEQSESNVFKSFVMVATFVIMMLGIIMYMTYAILDIASPEHAIFNTLKWVNLLWLFCVFILTLMSAFSKSYSKR